MATGSWSIDSPRQLWEILNRHKPWHSGQLSQTRLLKAQIHGKHHSLIQLQIDTCWSTLPCMKDITTPVNTDDHIGSKLVKVNLGYRVHNICAVVPENTSLDGLTDQLQTSVITALNHFLGSDLWWCSIGNELMDGQYQKPPYPFVNIEAKEIKQTRDEAHLEKMEAIDKIFADLDLRREVEQQECSAKYNDYVDNHPSNGSLGWWEVTFYPFDRDDAQKTVLVRATTAREAGEKGETFHGLKEGFSGGNPHFIGADIPDGYIV